MEKIIFSVFDSAAGLFLEPFFAPSIEFAIREFRQVVNTEGHKFNVYPADFTLFMVGEFNAVDGAIKAIEPRSLGVGVTFVASAMPALEA